MLGIRRSSVGACVCYNAHRRTLRRPKAAHICARGRIPRPRSGGPRACFLDTNLRICATPEPSRCRWHALRALAAKDRCRCSARPLLLVVDDELPVLKVVERLAAKVGFDVVTCASGAEAMRTLMRKPADLAMVDLRMPDVNGLDLLRQIRTSVPGCEVILMTAYAAVDSAVEAIKLGAREYLTKPFDFDRLRQVLDRHPPGAGAPRAGRRARKPGRAAARVLRDARAQPRRCRRSSASFSGWRRTRRSC